MRFITPMWHPNSWVLVTTDYALWLTHLCPIVYSDGAVCISILVGRSLIGSSQSLTLLQHPPGDDQYGYEDSGERWLPVHTVESIVSCLSYPIVPGSKLMFDSVVKRHLSLVL